MGRKQKIRRYLDHLAYLVECERREEMRRHDEEIRRLSGRARERAGRAILHLRGRDEGEGLGGTLVKFMRHHAGEPLPDTEIGVGDLVQLSKNHPHREDNPVGTVAEKSRYAITVVFDDEPHSMVFGRELRMDLYVNDVTYRRMLAAIDELRDASGRARVLRDIFAAQSAPRRGPPVEIEAWHDESLDDSQRAAARAAMRAPDIYCVHGPPGTGKTTTLLEVAWQAVGRGERVLATAASNVAVDNLLEPLVAAGVRAVRVGHPVRVTPAMRAHTLDYMVEEHPLWEEYGRLRREAFARKDAQQDEPHPSGRRRRGLSDAAIKRLATKERSRRGVDVPTLKGMARWLRLREEAEEYFDRADRCRDRAVASILEDAQVICSTLSTAGSDVLADEHFDLVVIDEATQATEPGCLIPVARTRRVVMAGDHRQLPPTVGSREALEGGLRRTLFEKMVDEWGDTVSSMLEVQYRMHDRLAAFSSERFYDGALRSAPGVGARTLVALGVETGSLEAPMREILDPDEPLVLVDTAELEAGERQRARSHSRENPIEAQLVAAIVEAAIAAGCDAGELAVIAPYGDQVDLLRELLGAYEELEVHTVDGFQGREKEVVVLSLTRSNAARRVGFVADERRLNVAVTRARAKLVAVGDVSTLESAEVFEAFARHVERTGRVVRPTSRRALLEA